MSKYIIHSAVKKYIKSLRTKKVFVTKEFLDLLNNEIKRVLSIALENSDDRLLFTLPLPSINQIVGTATRKNKKLICRKQIRLHVKKARPDIWLPIKFFEDINMYTCAIAIASLQLVDGTYMKKFVAGNAVAKVAERNLNNEINISMGGTRKEKIIFEAALPCENVSVEYEICVQNAILKCTQTIYTAKTTEKLKKAIYIVSKRYIEALGIYDDVVINLTKISRRR